MKLSEKHPKFSKVLRAVSFFVLLIFLLSLFSFMLEPKDNTADSGINNPNSRGFYSEPRNSIQIMVIGNSDAYSGFSPLELWNMYGYTSYISAEGRQRTSEAVNMLQEILTCQKPKIVIYETDAVFTGGGRADRVQDTFLASLNKLAPLVLYHDRWKVVKFSEMFKKPVYNGHYFAKGQKLSNVIIPNTDGYVLKSQKAGHISLTVEPYLDQLVSICKENDITLLFMELPSASSWNDSKHKVIAKYAKEHDIKFLDLDRDRSKFGFDWSTDSRDGGNHLNTAGARKATRYIGKYIKANFSLEDQRKDVILGREWNADYKKYKKLAKI